MFQLATRPTRGSWGAGTQCRWGGPGGTCCPSPASSPSPRHPTQWYRSAERSRPLNFSSPAKSTLSSFSLYLFISVCLYICSLFFSPKSCVGLILFFQVTLDEFKLGRFLPGPGSSSPGCPDGHLQVFFSNLRKFNYFLIEPPLR